MTRGGRNVYVSRAKRAAYLRTLNARNDLSPKKYAALVPYKIPIPAVKIANSRIRRLPKYVKATFTGPNRMARLHDFIANSKLMKGKLAVMRIQHKRKQI